MKNCHQTRLILIQSSASEVGILLLRPLQASGTASCVVFVEYNPSSAVDALAGERWLLQRHHTSTKSAITTDPPHCTSETLTHKHRLLWQRSNLLACRLSINDCLILLAHCCYTSGTCKSPAIDCTAFDYICLLRKMLIGHYSECKWGWRSHILNNQWIFWPGLLSVARTDVCAYCNGFYIHTTIQHWQHRSRNGQYIF